MLHAARKLIGLTDSLWRELLGGLSSFSKAMLVSGMIVCAVLALVGLGAEIYGAAVQNAAYAVRCARSVTEGGFRCLLLGAVCSLVTEFCRRR